MTYEEAKAIVEEHAPGFILDPDEGGRQVTVRKADGTRPHAIILPNHKRDKANYDAFLVALEQAKELAR